MADNFSDIKITQLDAFLQKFPKLNTLLTTNEGVSFSSFEVMLPIILDNFENLNTNIESFSNANRKNAFRQINLWLKSKGYIVDNKVSDKVIDISDSMEFAVFYCNTLHKNNLISTQEGNLKDENSGVLALNPDFFNKQIEIEGLLNDTGEQVSLSLHDGISKLRSQQVLYSDVTDKVLRDLVINRFDQKDAQIIGKDKSGKTVYFGTYINTHITNSWNVLVHKEDILKKLLSISELADETWVNKNVDAISFYEHLKECVNNNVGGLGDDADIKNIVDNFDPRAILFLTQKLENTATKNYQVPNRYKDVKIYSGIIDDVKKHIAKVGYIIKQLAVKMPGDITNKIYDSKDNKFVIPKPVTPVNVEAFKYLLVDDINVDKNSIEQRINELPEKELYSLDHNLSNPYVESYVSKWFTVLFTKKVLKNQYGFTAIDEGDMLAFTSEPYTYKDLDGTEQKGFKLKESQDSLTIFTERLKDIITNYKVYLNVLKEIIKELTSGKYNYDSTDFTDIPKGKQDDAKFKASMTNLYMRGYTKTFNEKLNVLSKYSKANGLDNVNYETIVEDAEELQNFVLDPGLMASNTLISINEDLEEIVSGEYKKFDVDSSLTREKFKEIYTEKQKEAEVFVEDIKKYINERLNILQSTPDTSVDDLDLYLGKFGQFINSLSIKREAAYKFNESDLDEFFKELYNQTYDTTSKVLSETKQSLLSDIYNVDSVAHSIINLLNLRNVQNLNKVQIGAYINQLLGLNSYATYRNILAQSIDLDFIQSNLTSVIDAIYNIVNSKNIQLNYTDILNSILALNKDLNINEFVNTSESDYAKFIKDNEVSTFDASTVSGVSSLDQFIAFVASILFKTYRKSVEDSKAVSLLSYLDNQKFNLLLDVCDSLSANKTAFTDRVTSAIELVKNKEYLLNSENKFDRLSEQFLYRGEPTRVLQTISNYKVLSNIRAILFTLVNSDPILSSLMQDCTDWDFSDKLVNALLKYAKIFDISGELVNGNINDLRSNISLPFSQKYVIESSFEDKIRIIFNKLKGLSSASQNKNIVAVMLDLIKTNAAFKGILNDLEKLYKKMYNKKQSDSDDDIEALKQESAMLETTLNRIKNLVDKSKNNGIVNSVIEDKIEVWKTKYKEILPYISIKLVSNRHQRGMFTKEFDILPVDIVIDTAAIQNNVSSVSKEISDLDRKLQKIKFLITQKLYNSVIDSSVEPEILSGLKVLLDRTDNMLNDLTDKIQEKFKGKIITIPYVMEKVELLKSYLINYIVAMCKDTNDCYELTMKFSDDLTKLWKKVEDTTVEYEI